jgi:signal transduction histidine kinase
MASVRSLRGRLTLWTTLATLAGLLVFGAVACVVVALEEQAEADSGVPDDPDDAAPEAAEEMLIALAVAAPVGIGLSIAGARWASGRAMASIEAAAHTAARISVDSFDRRMAVPGAGHELRPLALALNDLLDRLQQGYQALAAFSANASHELRTPLAAVCSELEVSLRRPRTVEEWRASAETSLAELRRLASVVEAMLRFAQADAARDADREDVVLADVVDEVVAIHGEVAARAGVTLAASHGDAGIVRGDASLLSTALGNLVANAIRAAGQGGRVTVALDGTTLQVDDTGPGLPVERDALFEPFAMRSPGGVGLGLAIAHRIVSRHGGELSYADRDGGGARFTIALPTHDER